MSRLLPLVDILRPLLYTRAAGCPSLFLADCSMLLFAVALFREVLICEREENAVLDVLVNRRTAKGYSEVFIFFLLE